MNEKSNLTFVSMVAFLMFIFIIISMIYTILGVFFYKK